MYLRVFTCIYELQNWFSIANFSDLNEIENLNYEFFYSIVIVLHVWVQCLNFLKCFIWVYGLLTSWLRKEISDYILPKAIMPKSNQAAKKVSQMLILFNLHQISLVQQEVKKQVKQVAKSHYENILLKIREETGNYAAIHEYNYHHRTGFSKIYAKFSLKRATVIHGKKSSKKDIFSLARSCEWWDVAEDQRYFNRITCSGSSNISKNGNCNYYYYFTITHITILLIW